MAGASAPVVRSVLMASVVLLGSLSYKKLDPTRVLFLVAFMLAFINPYSLPFDPSFQLSFLATFAIINFSTPVEKRLLFIRTKTLREVISQTIAVLLFVSPFILYTMGNFSVVALVTNILVLPIVPILMLLGFLVAVLSFIPFLATMCAFIVVSISAYVFFIVHFFAELPFASITLNDISFIYILPIYTILLFMLYKKKQAVISQPSLTDLTDPH
jgi:competence protein ComEC